jgi:hypothetical protein
MIGFLAKRRRGKDTACDYLVEKGYTKGTFALPLKKGVQEMFGFTDEQLFTDKKDEKDDYWGVSPREVCQFVGTEVVRNMFPTLVPGIGNDFWVKKADKWYEDTMSDHKGDVVWSDVRFQNEVDFILSKGGKVYKIERFEMDKKEKNSSDQHASEMDMDKIINYTDVLVNDGTLQDFYNLLENKISK